MYTFFGWCIVLTIIYFVNPFRNFFKWKEERNKRQQEIEKEIIRLETYLQQNQRDIQNLKKMKFQVDELGEQDQINYLSNLYYGEHK